MQIPAYFINLNRSTSRRKYMEDMAQKIGIQVSRVEAVDGKTLSRDEFDSIHPEDGKMRRMTKSEVACFLSHRKVWSTIYQGKDDYAAVFEDDIHMSMRLGHLLTNTSWIGPEMEIIKLDKATNKSVKLGPLAEHFDDFYIRPLKSLHVGTGAYIISRKCAVHLFLQTEMINQPVDHFIFDNECSVGGSLSKWQINPAVCIHQQFRKERFLPAGAEESTLQGERKDSQGNYMKEMKGRRAKVYKIWREVKRPFIQLLTWCFHGVSNFFTKDKWVKIGFDNE